MFLKGWVKLYIDILFSEKLGELTIYGGGALSCFCAQDDLWEGKAGQTPPAWPA